MKNYFTILGICVMLLVALFPTQLVAQDDETTKTKVKNVIKTNVLGAAFFNSYSLAYERQLVGRASLNVTVEYSKLDLKAKLFVSGFSTTISGVSVTPEFRVYPVYEHGLFNGFFVGGFLVYRRLGMYKTNSPGLTANLNSYGAGLNLGYQWLIRKRVTIEALLGSGYVTKDFRPEFPATRADFVLGRFDNNFYPVVGLSVGYAF